METNGAIISLQKFMRTWQYRRWKKLLKFSQITWVKSGHPTLSAIEWFQAWFTERIPYSYTILNTKINTDVSCDIEMSVMLDDFKSNKKVVKKMTARVICEKSPYQTSVRGKWGVNPVSCLRKEYHHEN